MYHCLKRFHSVQEKRRHLDWGVSLLLRILTNKRPQINRGKHVAPYYGAAVDSNGLPANAMVPPTDALILAALVLPFIAAKAIVPAEQLTVP